jgi:hypothetical protein
LPADAKNLNFSRDVFSDLIPLAPAVNGKKRNGIHVARKNLLRD